MGCDNSKEKIEDQMMKMKMDRIELQMERYKALQQLKEIDGTDMKIPAIPDYVDENFIKENNEKNQEIFDTMNQDISKKKKPLRPRRSKSFHTKRKFVKFDEEENTEKTGRTKRGKTVYKKRTLKG